MERITKELRRKKENVRTELKLSENYEHVEMELSIVYNSMTFTNVRWSSEPYRKIQELYSRGLGKTQ